MNFVPGKNAEWDWAIEPNGRYHVVVKSADDQKTLTGKFTFNDGVWDMVGDRGWKMGGAYCNYGELGVKLIGSSANAILWRVPKPCVHAPTEAAGAGDPAIVGLWHGATQTRSHQSLDQFWAISPSGRYCLETVSEGGTADPPIEQGKIEFANGTWTLKSDQGRTDQGRFERDGTDAVVVTGRDQPALWWRLDEPLAGPAAEMDAAIHKLQSLDSFHWTVQHTSSNQTLTPVSSGSFDKRGWIIQKYPLLEELACIGFDQYGFKAQKTNGVWIPEDRSKETAVEITALDMYSQFRFNFRNARKTATGYSADIPPLTVKDMRQRYNPDDVRPIEDTGTIDFTVKDKIATQMTVRFAHIGVRNVNGKLVKTVTSPGYVTDFDGFNTSPIAVPADIQELAKAP